MPAFYEEKWSANDASFEKTFGIDYSNAEAILPLGRKETLDKLNLPAVCQKGNTCVSAAWAFAKQWQEKNEEALDHLWLAEQAGTVKGGVMISAVAETAAEIGIPTKKAVLEGSGFFEAKKHRVNSLYLERLDRQTIYTALKHGIVAVGVKDWNGNPDLHMLALVDVDENGNWIAANWSIENVQEYVTLNKNIIFTEAVSIPDELPKSGIKRLGLKSWLLKALPFALSSRNVRNTIFKVSAGVLGLLALLTGSEIYGSLSLPGKYRTTLRQDISASATTIPVSSITLRTGEVLSTSTIQFPVYLTIGSGSTEEDVECNSLDTSGPSWTNCTGRGLSLLGGASTSSVSGKAFPHAAGENVMLSTTPYSFNRFVDNFSNQSVTGTKTFTNGQIRIGDSVSSTCDYVYFVNNQSNSPYYKVCGPGAGNTTSTFYFSLDGLSDLQLNASGTTVGASSTKALELVAGQFAVVASSTGSLAFDSVTGALYVNPVFNLPASFATTVSFAAPVTFAATTTFSGTVNISTSVTTGTSITNKNYVDNSISTNFATGTAGIAITAGQALYISSTGTLFLADADAAVSAYPFAGIALSSASATQEVTYVKPGGIAGNQSGLTAGKYYYLSGTAGAISLTKGSLPVRMGLAMSSTAIMVIDPSFSARTSGSQAIVGNSGTVNVTTNFIPTRVDLICGLNNNGSSIGFWVANSNGSSAQYSTGNDTNSSPFPWRTSNSAACKWKESAAIYTATIATTTSGFSITFVDDVAGSASRQFSWVATVDDILLP